MQRRYFLKSGVALAVAAELGASKAHGLVRAHNWDKYDFGSDPNVTDRLNQGPFSQYAPDSAIPTDEVVMTTTPFPSLRARLSGSLGLSTEAE